MKNAETILNQALQQHKPSLIILSFSGGYDSMVACHYAALWARHHAHSTNVITLAVDTLLSADGWREFITSTSKALKLPRLEIRETTMLDKWQSDVRERGFAYRRHQHKIYFYYLKQNAFRAALADHKKHRTDRIMFVDGVRRDESSARAAHPAIARRGSGVYVSPLIHWSSDDIARYRWRHDMPENPFYARWGNSGDCGCNWHNNISAEAMQRHGSKAWEIIAPLHDHGEQTHGYGYDGEPAAKVHKDQLELPLDFGDTPYYCAGCERSATTDTQSQDFVALQRMEW